jgi:hypothetical protein
MRLSDAGLRQRQTKLIYLNHRSSLWLNEDVTRDRSNRLLDSRATAYRKTAQHVTPNRTIRPARVNKERIQDFRERSGLLQPPGASSSRVMRWPKNAQPVKTSAGEPSGTTNCDLPSKRAQTEQSNDSTTTPTTTKGQARLRITESNGEVERRGIAPT